MRKKKKRLVWNWKPIIEYALKQEKKGLVPFTFTDIERARWFTTCAIGEHRERFPKVVITECIRGELVPTDSSLHESGYNFYRAVQSQEPARALAIWEEIHKRVLELKRAAR